MRKSNLWPRMLSSEEVCLGEGFCPRPYWSGECSGCDGAGVTLLGFTPFRKAELLSCSHSLLILSSSLRAVIPSFRGGSPRPWSLSEMALGRGASPGEWPAASTQLQLVCSQNIQKQACHDMLHQVLISFLRFSCLTVLRDSCSFN